MDRERAYADPMTKTEDYTAALTTDPAILHETLQLVKQPNNRQSLIFYQRNVTLDALRSSFNKAGIPHLEVNGHLQNFFTLNDTESPVFVQYLSGASAFESKSSNNSIYLDLPVSAILLTSLWGVTPGVARRLTQL